MTPTRSTARDDRLLLWAAGWFAAAVLFHNFDHVRRGAGSVSTDVFVIGTAALPLEVGIVALVAQRHRAAALAAAIAGFSLATGYVVVHFLPARSWLSDSFTSGRNVSPLSWTAASLEVVAATALAVAGLVALKGRGGVASALQSRADQRSARALILHPVVLVMALGNLTVLLASLAQR